MNMDAYTFRQQNEKYTKEAIRDLEEIERISNLEDKWNEVNRTWWKHSQNFKRLKDNKPKEHLGYYPWSDLVKYEKEVKKLKELKDDILQKSSEIREKDINKNSNLPKEQTPKENSICWECHKTNSDKWFVNQETGLEFCSQACNLEHNAELCESCVQKCLKYENGIAVDYQTYYKDNETKTGTLCSDCKQKQRKNLEDKLKKLEEEQTEDKEELEKIKNLIENNNSDDYNKKDISNKDNNPTSNNLHIRERERERERETKSNQIWTNYSLKSLS